jgi:hypothetical protein
MRLKAGDSKSYPPQLLIKPLPILLRIPWTTRPVPPDGREDRQCRDALAHERDFYFRVLRPVIVSAYLLIRWGGRSVNVREVQVRLGRQNKSLRIYSLHSGLEVAIIRLLLRDIRSLPSSQHRKHILRICHPLATNSTHFNHQNDVTYP